MERHIETITKEQAINYKPTFQDYIKGMTIYYIGRLNEILSRVI